MAAYAAIVSLMNTIYNIHNHRHLSTSVDRKQMESLGEKLDFLLDFVERYNSNGGGGISKEEVEDLEGQIASAARAAEDVIESHIVDQIHAGLAERSCISLLDLQKTIEDMDVIKEKVAMVKEERGFEDLQPTYSVPAASSTPPVTTAMVGFDDDELTQLLERLTGQQSDRQVIPIVGVGGIGKTTLARNVYENLVVVQHFDVCAGASISQQLNVKRILIQLLSCLIIESTNRMDEKTEDQLGKDLYEILSGRRYLIVLDDMRSISVWEKIECFFPDNNNSSRVIVTTRLSSVANHFGCSGISMNFLDDDKSWSLFCEKAFAQEGCPPQLEAIGKKIVKNCRGLPLSIVVVGGLLRKSSRMLENWENVAKTMSSVLDSGEDHQCLDILYLSYCHLPACLKPCFLYLGIFPEDHEIHVSRLINLWIAEGFLKPNKDQSLEEVAEGYIKDLVDRNLILVRRLRSNGKFETCRIHDLLRELCLRVAEKEKFLCVMRELDIPRDISRERRIVIHESPKYPSPVFGLFESASLARSLIHEQGSLSCKPRLVRVLIKRGVLNSLDSTLRQVNLRFLDYKIYRTMDPSVGLKILLPKSLPWHVQTLIVVTGANTILHAPSEIWEMSQLRHLEFNLICLPDPPPSDDHEDIVLRNLQTLTTVLNFRCNEEVCKRMPNIQKLHIRYGGSWEEGETRPTSYCLHNVGRLTKLESLNYKFVGNGIGKRLLRNLTFPSSLKMLSLDRRTLCQEDLTMIGSLPLLEVLTLISIQALGHNWKPVEGEFLSLKFLGIYDCGDLVCWNAADSTHFPVLEKLFLQHLRLLDEIPSGIGDISTLKAIRLVKCSISLALSAMKILEKRESLGDQGLKVRVEVWNKNKREKLREMVELKGFTSHNFQIY